MPQLKKEDPSTWRNDFVLSYRVNFHENVHSAIKDLSYRYIKIDGAGLLYFFVMFLIVIYL